MLVLFLFDWIEDYINTPQLEITAGQEILYYLALAIIFVIVLSVICLVWTAINWIKERNNEKTHKNK